MTDTQDKDPYAEYGWLRRTFMRHPYIFSFVVGVVLLTGIRPFLRHEPEPPHPGTALPAFNLLDRTGKAVTLNSFHGDMWIIGFIRTRSKPSVARLIETMKKLDGRYSQEKLPIRFALFTVEPTHDIPALLKRLGKTYQLPAPRWKLLTSSTNAAMKTLVEEGFRTRYPAPGQSLTAQQPGHSQHLWLMDDKAVLRRHPDEGREYFITTSKHVDYIFEWSRLLWKDIQKKKSAEKSP